MAYILYYGGSIALVALFVVAIALLTRNYIVHRNKNRQIKEEDMLERTESSSIQGVIHESASNIANVVKRGNRIYTQAVDGLARQDRDILKKNKKQVNKLSQEVESLRDHIFYFIKNLDDSSVGASNFYINILGYLQDITQSLEYISQSSLKHINNNHKKLKFSQIKELKEVDERMELLFNDTMLAFESRSFENIGTILRAKKGNFDFIKDKIAKQVSRTRNEESSPKNTTLYFSLLLETKDLLTAMMNLLEEYYNSHDSSVPPAILRSEEEE